MARDLTEKQRRFVEAYMGQAKGNAAEAARMAGYSAKDAHGYSVVGDRLLASVGIREAIAELTQATRSSAIAEAAEIQGFLSDVMRGALGHTELNMGGEPVQVSPPWKVRVTAAVELAKMRGQYAPTKAEVKHEGTAVVVRFPRRAET